MSYGLFRESAGDERLTSASSADHVRYLNAFSGIFAIIDRASNHAVVPERTSSQCLALVTFPDDADVLAFGGQYQFAPIYG
jgi:hypothetical protein